ncbi:MAG: hypothetical protein IJJ55_01735 [Clostridia bacterium]|nr:hypothetical protein [Clostridia bacterium]
MNNKHLIRRIMSVLIAVFLAVATAIPIAVTVYAQNTLFISEVTLAAGEAAAEKLEKDGWSVMMTGLNRDVSADKQVYLAYKTNTGDAITNVIIAKNAGDSLKDNNGISYKRASETDADEGVGGGAGCLYYTRDKKAGTPLVGFDILRSKEEPLYPITNDGAEIVRNEKGAPADLESTEKKSVIYLAQIRDGIVRPYIAEIGIVTDTDKWNAVYTACERGYNYYVDGDIDGSDDTYTLLVYKRTADLKQAVTNITAVSAVAIKEMEKQQIIDEAASSTNLTGDTIGISGIEYVRVSKNPVDAKTPYYLYQTKNTSAGNPVSMLYKEKLEEAQNFIFGTWAQEYFFSEDAATNAATFSANEDLYAQLCEDLTVCTKLPVQYLDSIPSVKTAEPVTEKTTTQKVEETTTKAQTDSIEETEETSEEESDTEAASEEITEETTEETTTEKETTTEATTQVPTEEPKYINILMLTPRDGLPQSVAQITGLRDNLSETPVTESDARSERKNKLPASVFGKGGPALVIGSIVIAAGVVSAIVIRKKKSEGAK